VRPVAGVDVIKIRGKLALGEATIHDLRSRLAELVEHRRYNWLLDMEGVTFLDSSGVGILVQAMTSSRNRQGQLPFGDRAGPSAQGFEVGGPACPLPSVR